MGGGSEAYLYRACELLGEIRDLLRAQAGGEDPEMPTGNDDQGVTLAQEPARPAAPARAETEQTVNEIVTPAPPVRRKGRR